MKMLNDTGLQFAWLPGKIRFPEDSLTLVAKGTYTLAPGAVATLAEDDQEQFSADIYEDEQPGQGCLYDGDFAYYKPRADALLLGTCHCPGGQAQTSCRVSFGVGPVKKSLAVYGDYYASPGTQPLQISSPRPFVSMPLRYRNSYGGEGYAANPVGKGFVDIPDANGKPVRPLPNVQPLGRPLAALNQPQDPAGFGPLDRTWAQRMSRMGSYDAAWEAERWPWFPADFDWGALNAAPPDQQIDGFLRGDEPLAFENLHPQHANYRSQMPGVRVRCFVQGDAPEGSVGPIREVEMRLDTVWIDMDKERLVLQWRGVTPIRSPKYEELSKALLVTEAVGESVPAESYYALFAADGAEGTPSDLADLQAEATADDPAPPEPPDLAAIEADVKVEVAAELDKMITPRSRAADGLRRVKEALLSADPKAALAAFGAEANVDEAAFDRQQEEERKRVAKVVAAHGFDPADLDDPPEPPPPPPPPTKPDFEARAAAGTSLAGEDLSGENLAGANFRGADLADAILAGANLANADLSGADLSGAVLEGADLSSALLSGARLDNADLTRARLAGANLNGASLQDALLAGANLSGAQMVEASAPGAQFLRANLTQAKLDRAVLDGADFAGSRLDGATLNAASLKRASMGNAVGNGAQMIGADLTDLRAGDGCGFPRGQFAGVRGDGSTWCDARLAGADFSMAELLRADFSGADLVDANFGAAELRNADFSAADLTSAQLSQANLFQASFKLANLSYANLSNSNCFQAEFWDANIGGADLSGANIKMTKLAPASA